MARSHAFVAPSPVSAALPVASVRSLTPTDCLPSVGWMAAWKDSGLMPEPRLAFGSFGDGHDDVHPWCSRTSAMGPRRVLGVSGMATAIGILGIQMTALSLRFGVTTTAQARAVEPPVTQAAMRAATHGAAAQPRRASASPDPTPRCPRRVFRPSAMYKGCELASCG